MKRILSWGGFVIIIGLIIWGMIVASNKAERESINIAPVDKITSSDWVKGATSSLITLVEYSDFQCPACGAYFPLVEEVITSNPSVRFVYRHFPLSIHPNAIPAAKASEAAGRQGKFWEMHFMLFSTQESWSTSTDPKTIFVGYAKKIGLNLEKFNTDFDLKEISDKIDFSYKSGLKAGVNSTPTFYLNGKKVNFQTNEQFKKLVEDASTTAKTS